MRGWGGAPRGPEGEVGRGAQPLRRPRAARGACRARATARGALLLDRLAGLPSVTEDSGQFIGAGRQAQILLPRAASAQPRRDNAANYWPTDWRSAGARADTTARSASYAGQPCARSRYRGARARRCAKAARAVAATRSRARSRGPSTAATCACAALACLPCRRSWALELPRALGLRRRRGG